MPTSFVVPAALTLNSPGQYSPGTGPSRGRDAERAQPGREVLAQHGEPLRGSRRAPARGGRRGRAPARPRGTRRAGRPRAGSPARTRAGARRPAAAGKPPASASMRLNAAVGRGLCTRSRPGHVGVGEVGEQLRWTGPCPAAGWSEPWTRRTGASPNGPVTAAASHGGPGRPSWLSAAAARRSAGRRAGGRASPGARGSPARPSSAGRPCVPSGRSVRLPAFSRLRAGSPALRCP